MGAHVHHYKQAKLAENKNGVPRCRIPTISIFREHVQNFKRG